MSENKDTNEAACGGSALTAVLGADTPRVEALIARVMAAHQSHTAYAQAKYYEEVHQDLAPLAREMERENAQLRRQFGIAKRQWENWKEEAFRLNARLQKYEPGSPMLLNSAVPNACGEPGLTEPGKD